eukprot:SAG22_NODE_17895_length_297_cov_0.398990_1_plen_91_part_10
MLLLLLDTWWAYLAIIILAILGFTVPKPLKAFLNKKAINKEAKTKADTLAAEESKQAKLKEEQLWNDKRSQVLEMAKSNPETMAHMLLDWI